VGVIPEVADPPPLPSPSLPHPARENGRRHAATSARERNLDRFPLM